MIGLMGLVLVLCIVGVVLVVFPMDATIRKIIIGLVVIIALVWLFGSLGWVSTPNLR